MNGEFSRLSFDARKHFAAVLQQQGRVGVDSDWNEWVEILLHRLRVETLDLIGGCGRPRDNAGFGLSLTDNGTPSPILHLSPGRLYAGGLLASFEADARFDQQLDWPFPPQAAWTPLFPGIPYPGLDFAVLADGATRRDLFYAEVWLRHVTALNDEALRAQILADVPPPVDWNSRPEVGDLIREQALGGPDTCTRLQTVAQVKPYPLTDPAINDCDAACAALNAARPTRTSGQMQVNVQPEAPFTEPCRQPQLGGYGGTENRTYRVQIHDPGSDGVATFKWSNENGAFTVRVRATAFRAIAAGGNIDVESIGPDQITQLRQNDWVELCGEETELGQWRNPLAQLQADPVRLPDGRYRLQLTRDVVVPRAPFLRRWSDGARPIVLGTDFPLDPGSGMSVRFSDPAAAGGQPVFFHDLDYWTWAARADTRAVEPLSLTNTPQAPRGIERYYCCLGIITWQRAGADITGSIVECDNLFPRDTNCCCCTVVVGNGINSHGRVNDLRQAFALLPPEGGIICLLPGVHELPDAIDIPMDNVVVHGCRTHHRIIAPNGAFTVDDKQRVAFTGLRIDADGSPAIMSRRARHLTIRDCEFHSYGQSPCLILQGVDVTVSDNILDGDGEGVAGLALWGPGRQIAVRRNLITNGTGNGITFVALPGESLRAERRRVSRLDGVEITHNRILGMALEGIATAFFPSALDDSAFRPEDFLFLSNLTIRWNTIEECATGGLARARVDELNRPLGAITLVDVERADISDNCIQDNGTEIPFSGIQILFAAGVRLDRNELHRNGLAAESGGSSFQAGILIALALPLPLLRDTPSHSPSDGSPSLTVCDNVVTTEFRPALVAAGLGDMKISRNQLATRGLRAERSLPGQTVTVFNFGPPLDGGPIASLRTPIRAGRFGTARPAPALSRLALLGGRIAFHDNQCNLDILEDGHAAIASIVIVTFDDLSFAGNQSRCLTQPATGLRGNSLVIAPTLRVSNNRLTETLALRGIGSLLFSCLGLGSLTTGVGNQGTHCLFFLGTSATAVDLNLVNAAMAKVCPQLQKIVPRLILQP